MVFEIRHSKNAASAGERPWYGHRHWRSHRGLGRVVVSAAITLTLALVAGSAAAVVPAIAAAAGRAPSVPHDKSIPVTPVTSHYQQPKPMPTWQATKPTWPSGTADVTLSSAATPHAATGTGSQTRVQAGSLPVWISPATGQPAAPAGSTSPSTTATSSLPSTVHVGVAPQASATAAGVTGLLLSVQRTDNATTPGDAHLTLDYTQFKDAFGGDWASRLRLVALPDCALTTPDLPDCRTQSPVMFTHDGKAGTLSADITLPGAQPAAAPTAAPQAAASPMAVFAATSSGSGGGGGDYTATSLQPSGSWQAGGSADSFGWSYPIPVPSVPGGLAPKVQLAYNSQSVDGLTSSTNNQASWIGDGWSYSPGYVERAYQSCHQNPAGVTQTQDICWSADNTLTLSLNGQNTTLVRDDATGTYRPQNDTNERVQYLTGAANGAQNGEYFVVTTPDGTQYYFGLNQLPGWAAGNATTNSVWTEPVYATSPGQPCYNATFANSWCQQGYRWNLDYVVDTHSDVVSYFYNTQTNFYAQNQGSTATAPYIRSGYLTKIAYGQRVGQVYSTSPAAQVLFTATGRCNQANCDPSTLSPATASNWPDVPYDQNCASGAACSVPAPTFWSEYTLQSIQTQVLVGSTETNVDSWTLAHTFPATGDSTTPSLWLSSITRTGQDTTAGGSSSPITLPPVVYTGTPLSNRVNLLNGYPPITRHRLTKITTETGKIINVNYSAPACGSSTPADPSQNTMLCYPNYWTPTGQISPMLDWFNKFIVSGVTEQDPTGGSANDTIATTYTPVGAPAWHYNGNPLTPSNQRTWDEWRGFQGMIVSTGTSPDPVTKKQYTYFRGMDGDTLPNGGTRSVKVTDSRNDPAVTDANQYSGMTYETIVYNGSAVVSDTISNPWTSGATATHALTGLPAQQSFHLGTADTKVYTPLANGTTRTTETDFTYDAYGRATQVNDQGDVSTTADDVCTTTSFADNVSAWILNKPAQMKTVSVNCSTTPSLPANAVSDTLTFYDGSTTLGAGPTVGDRTMSQQAASYTGSTPNYVTVASATVDQYGRSLTTTDADNRTTTTAYTPATGAEPTSITVTNPLSHTTTSTFDSLRDLRLTSTDPAGYVTTEQYDAFGRLTAVYEPGISGTSYPPNLKYSYTISNTGPSVVNTYTLNDDATYRLAETLYDSLLRARETQLQTPGNGRTITDTIYNTNGQVSETTAPYYNSSPVSTTYVQAQVGQVPSATGFSYDGAARKTAEIAYALGTQTWQTTYAYGGNFVTTVPPAGGTASSTVTDARGRTTDLYQYHTGVPADPINNPPSAYSDTKYTYFPNGKKATVVDAAGNTWSYQYDLLGNLTSSKDPDTGTNTITYDNAGQPLSATDARGKQTTNTYDLAGRKTATYDTTTTQTLSAANKTASWTYDTLKKGYPTSATSYSGGDVYAKTILAYNTYAKPQATKVTLTGEGTTLVPAAGYVTGYGYSLTGHLTNLNDAAAGGLPQENVVYGYDQFGEPTSVDSSLWSYVTAVGYSNYGQPLQYTFGPSTNNVWQTLSYDDQTRALTGIKTTTSVSPTVVDEISYGYSDATVSKGAGLITSIKDSQNAGATVDTQCFQYDYATRLSAAWSATDACAATPRPGSSPSVGGPNPYWQSWTYNPAGDRTTQVDHDPAGVVANDTTTTYNYPNSGPNAVQPHTLTNTTSVGPGAAANTASYTYDPAGNTTSMAGGFTGSQTLTWDNQGKLATDTTAAGVSSYVYDTSGNLVVRRDPGKTTFFMGDEQLVLDTATNTVSAVRYYTLGAATVAVRNSAGAVQYLVPDRQGTDALVIDSNTEAVTRRQFLPFGQVRGSAPAWPGDRGYVGGTTDAATNLVNLGAREYNPASGRFLSSDAVFELSDPTQMGGYGYAGNNPTTRSDPTGLKPAGCEEDHLSCATGGPLRDAAPPPSPDDPVIKWNQPRIKAIHDPVSHKNYINHVQMPAGMDFDKTVPLLAAFFATDYFRKFHANWGWNLDDPMYRDDAVIQMLQHVCGMDTCGKDVGKDLFAMHLVHVPIGFGEGSAGGAEAVAAARGLGRALGPKGIPVKISERVQKALCNSFAGDTPVLMADGSSKPIDQVKVGDTIENAAPDSATVEAHTVTAIHITDTDRDFVDLTIDTLAGPKTITTTAHHLFWNTTTHTWTNATDLHPDDQLDTPGNGHATIHATRPYTATLRTYNLTIDTLHTYYVQAGTTPVLVHNDSCVAAASVPNLHGSSLEEAEKVLQGEGFQFKNETSGDYRKYVHPDGSKIWIRPNGEVQRLGPKVDPGPNQKNYAPRYGPDGRLTDEHSTGEMVVR